MGRGSWHCIGGSDQNHPQGKKFKKAKWLSEEAFWVVETIRNWKAKEKGMVYPSECSQLRHSTVSICCKTGLVVLSCLFTNSREKKGKAKRKGKVKSLSRVRLFATPWTVAHQAPPSTGFSRQQYWSGLPFPSPGIFLTQWSNPGLPHCRQTSYHLSHQGSPRKGKIYPSECRVPENNKEIKESFLKWTMPRNTIEWERLEISSRKLLTSRENFMQSWAW